MALNTPMVAVMAPMMMDGIFRGDAGAVVQATTVAVPTTNISSGYHRNVDSVIVFDHLYLDTPRDSFHRREDADFPDVRPNEQEHDPEDSL